MKKLLAISLCLILTLCSACALAEGDITVTATASVAVSPDMAHMYIGVTTTSPTAEQAQAKNAELMQKVMDTLSQLGIAASDATTSSFSANPAYDYSAETPAITGYSIDNTLYVTVRDLSIVSKVIDSAMSAGAHNVYGLEFASSKSGEAYDQALTQAVAEAKRKAELLAQAAGLTIESISSLTEQPSGISPVLYRSNTAAMDTAGATPIEAGTLNVSATVLVSFETK